MEDEFECANADCHSIRSERIINCHYTNGQVKIGKRWRKKRKKERMNNWKETICRRALAIT